MSETLVTVRLSEVASAKLAARAAETGRGISEVAADILETAVNRPSVEEALAPFRREVAESGMGDEELDGFLRGQLELQRREKAKRT